MISNYGCRCLGPCRALQDLVVDVVKEELGLKAGMRKEETNDWVIRKTVGGPLRRVRRE